MTSTLNQASPAEWVEAAQHNRKYYATAISSPDHFLNQSAFRKLDINQSHVLKFNQASLSATL